MTGTNRPWTATAVILTLAVLGALAGLWAGRILTPVGGAIEDERDLAADLVLQDLDGRSRRLAEWRGQPVLINYWATWCPPCVEELPRLAALHEARAKGGLAVLTIAQEEDAARVRDFLARIAPGLPAYIEPPPHDSSLLFGNERRLLPFSVLIDAEGRVLRRKAGALSASELEDWAAEAISAGR